MHMLGTKYFLVSGWCNKNCSNKQMTSKTQTAPIPLGKMIKLDDDYTHSLMCALCVKINVILNQDYEVENTIDIHISLNIYFGSTYSKHYFLVHLRTEKASAGYMFV